MEKFCTEIILIFSIFTPLAVSVPQFKDFQIYDLNSFLSTYVKSCTLLGLLQSVDKDADTDTAVSKKKIFLMNENSIENSYVFQINTVNANAKFSKIQDLHKHRTQCTASIILFQKSPTSKDFDDALLAIKNLSGITRKNENYFLLVTHKNWTSKVLLSPLVQSLNFVVAVEYSGGKISLKSVCGYCENGPKITKLDSSKATVFENHYRNFHGKSLRISVSTSKLTFCGFKQEHSPNFVSIYPYLYFTYGVKLKSNYIPYRSKSSFGNTPSFEYMDPETWLLRRPGPLIHYQI